MPTLILAHPVATLAITALAALILFILWQSVQVVGPAEVGLVMKRFGVKLSGDNPVVRVLTPNITTLCVQSLL